MSKKNKIIKANCIIKCTVLQAPKIDTQVESKGNSNNNLMIKLFGARQVNNPHNEKHIAV
jgi:hypothetical protein